jgi:hypothetical protein
LHLVHRVQQDEAAAPALHSLGTQKQRPDANRCQEADAGKIDYDTLVGIVDGAELQIMPEPATSNRPSSMTLTTPGATGSTAIFMFRPPLAATAVHRGYMPGSARLGNQIALASSK